MGFIIALVVLVCCMFMYCCCRVAGDADRKSEEMMRKHKEEI